MKAMISFISIIHALTCIFIVLFILFQDPKGGVLGSLGGGVGSKSFFGSEGTAPFLVKVTKWLAVIFACSSFYLSYLSSQKDSRLMAPDQVQEEPTQPQKAQEKPASIPEDSKKTQ